MRLREALREQNLIPASEFRELSQRNPGATPAQWQKLTGGRLRHSDGHVAFYSTTPLGCRSTSSRTAVEIKDVEFDSRGFDRALAEQRERARASWKGAAKQTANPAYQQLPKSDFEGYRQTRSDNCEVLAIIKDGQGRAGTQAR